MASNFSLTSVSKKYISSNLAFPPEVFTKPSPLAFSPEAGSFAAKIPPVGVLSCPSPFLCPAIVALTFIGLVFAPGFGGAVNFNQCAARDVIAAYPR